MKVTILVSTYNWPAALELSLRSMFSQTVLPDEIVIADDGSTAETAELIARLKQETNIPIKHIWHEDKGFRKTIVLNQAIAQATGDYILQVDGDVILSPYFVQDHLEVAQPNTFVCGSRVKLMPELTERMLHSPSTASLNWRELPISFVFNSFRSRLLRQFLADRYARKIDHLRGCNMAFWRNDLIKVNGYNEDLMQWGHEDGEIAYRLHFAGVKKRALKMGGNVYHLHHQENSRDNEGRHLEELEKVKREHLSWCHNGLDKYL